MPGRSIDHVVLAVDNLDRAAALFEADGFTLTPRGTHPDGMGTSNRLAQFASRNYLELLEVDRPGGIEDHDLKARPPRFSFGAHHKAFLRRGQGLAMLLLTCRDSRETIGEFQAAGLDTYAPFDFERTATLPVGTPAKVAFSLGFVTNPLMPRLAFAVCQHRFPENFWRTQYQRHGNGAQSIAAIYMAARQPERHVAFLTALTGGAARQVTGGYEIHAGSHEIIVLTPDGLSDLGKGGTIDASDGPAFAGLAIATSGEPPNSPGAAYPGGIFIEWRRARR
jgi:Glyoxalase-like domain